MTDRTAFQELARYEGEGFLWADGQRFGAVRYELREVQETLLPASAGTFSPTGAPLLFGRLWLREGHPFPLRRARVLVLELADRRERPMALRGELSPGQPLMVKSIGEWIEPAREGS